MTGAQPGKRGGGREGGREGARGRGGSVTVREGETKEEEEKEEERDPVYLEAELKHIYIKGALINYIKKWIRM